MGKGLGCGQIEAGTWLQILKTAVRVTFVN